MMTTVNISLSHDQVSLIDRLTQKYGFTNRSEFFRSVLRLLAHKPQVISDVVDFPFEPFVVRPLEEIEREFKKKGKYSPAFIKSLMKGLRKSSFYARSVAAK